MQPPGEPETTIKNDFLHLYGTVVNDKTLGLSHFSPYALLATKQRTQGTKCHI